MKPRVTVVIPTYQRPRALAACLTALAACEQPEGGVEVIVVDDGGGIPLERVVADNAAGLEVILHRQDNTGPAGARNVGASKAAGDLLAFLDDDCRPRADWLVALDRAARDRPAALLGGRTVNVLRDNPYAVATDLIVHHLQDWSNRRGDVEPFVPSCNLACATYEFAGLGGFGTDFPLAAGEDRDLCARWADHVGPVTAVPDAVVEHAHELDLGGFVRQHHGYGRGARRFADALTARRKDSRLFKGVRFYAELARRALARGGRVTALVALAQVASLTGYLRERGRGTESSGGATAMREARARRGRGGRP